MPVFPAPHFVVMPDTGTAMWRVDEASASIPVRIFGQLSFQFDEQQVAVQQPVSGIHPAAGGGEDPPAAVVAEGSSFGQALG